MKFFLKLILLPWSILRWIFCWLIYKGPAYNPAKWNSVPFVQCSNNCYNYACDIETDTFAQPGLASGAVANQMACADVSTGATADGLAAAGPNDACSGCCHRVALVVAPGEDFHWYRLDSSGYWSHKPGSTPAKNVDNSGQLITDPRTADRGPYTDFCGFFCVCNASVHIQGYGPPPWC